MCSGPWRIKSLADLGVRYLSSPQIKYQQLGHAHNLRHGVSIPLSCPLACSSICSTPPDSAKSAAEKNFSINFDLVSWSQI